MAKSPPKGKFIGAYFPQEEYAALAADAKAQGRSLRRHLRWLALKDTVLPEADRSAHAPLATCRVCGCTDDDCRQCIEKTGEPCHWVESDLCSACLNAPCFIVVDERQSYLTTHASGRWSAAGKIQARASNTSGTTLAAKTCAAKMLRITAKEVVLEENTNFNRPGYRQFTATKPQPQPLEDDDDADE